MAKIGETISEDDLESSSPETPKEPSLLDKLKSAYEHAKGIAHSKSFPEAASQYMALQNSLPGSNAALAGMTGALGPATAAAPAIAGLVNKAQGGTFGEGYKALQGHLAQNLNEHPGSGIVGGLAGGLAMPLPSIPGGSGVIGKALAGGATNALYGGAQGFGLGGAEGAASGAATGGALGTLGSLIGSGIHAAANSETLSPIVNRLKFLKPSPEEAQPLSEAGQNLREAISNTSAEGMWHGLPSREAMLERLGGAKESAGSQIGDMLERADLASPGGANVNFANSNAVKANQLTNANAMRVNPRAIGNLASEQQANVIGSSGSLADLNRAKTAINSRITDYPSNATQSEIDQITGGNQYLRALAKDVRGTIGQRISDISQIDPSVNAGEFNDAMRRYGEASDIMSPLNRAAGKEVSGSGNAHLYGGPSHIGFSMLGDMLNFGGRRQLAQAHLGEMAGKLDRALTTYKPAQSVARAFIAGTMPGLNEGEDEDNLQH